jgi:hypothetical protein
MIENLLTELKGALRQEVKQKTGLEQDKADQAIDLAAQSAREVAEQEVSRGNIQGLMQLMGSSESETHANPLVSKIGASYISKLVEQLGLTPEVAKQVEGVVVPMMVSYVAKQFKDAGGMGALGSLLGGMGGGMGGMLGGFFKK